jgi:hypothetical protein
VYCVVRNNDHTFPIRHKEHLPRTSTLLAEDGRVAGASGKVMISKHAGAFDSLELISRYCQCSPTSAPSCRRLKVRTPSA